MLQKLAECAQLSEALGTDLDLLGNTGTDVTFPNFVPTWEFLFANSREELQHWAPSSPLFANVEPWLGSRVS